MKKSPLIIAALSLIPATHGITEISEARPYTNHLRSLLHEVEPISKELNSQVPITFREIGRPGFNYNPDEATRERYAGLREREKELLYRMDKICKSPELHAEESRVFRANLGLTTGALGLGFAAFLNFRKR